MGVLIPESYQRLAQVGPGERIVGIYAGAWEQSDPNQFSRHVGFCVGLEMQEGEDPPLQVLRCGWMEPPLPPTAAEGYAPLGVLWVVYKEAEGRDIRNQTEDFPELSTQWSAAICWVRAVNSLIRLRPASRLQLIQRLWQLAAEIQSMCAETVPAGELPYNPRYLLVLLQPRDGYHELVTLGDPKVAEAGVTVDVKNGTWAATGSLTARIGESRCLPLGYNSSVAGVYDPSNNEHARAMAEVCGELIIGEDGHTFGTN